MSVVKKIIKIKSEDGTTYALGKNTEALIVEEIVFRRDGLAGINKGAKDESHYLIRLVGEVNNRDVCYRMVLAPPVAEVTFIEEEVREEKDDIKIEKVG